MTDQVELKVLKNGLVNRLNKNQQILLDNIQAIGGTDFGALPGEEDLKENICRNGPPSFSYGNQLLMLKTIQKVQQGEEVTFDEEFKVSRDIL